MAERVKRLKDLIDLVMQLPESPDRERLLSEIRSRAVDLDTGVAPRAMLPLREPAPAPRAAVPNRRPAVDWAQPRRAPVPASPRDPQLDWATLLGTAARLSLHDSPSRHDGRTARP